MNKEQEEALEAAKLAAMVSGQLKVIDQFSTERNNIPANKININNFVAKVKNPNLKIAPASYLTDVPAGFAPPPPEDYIQSLIPDTVNPNNPQPVIPIAAENTDIPVSVKMHPQPQLQQQKSFEIKTDSVVLTRSDVDSIRNSLKSIDKTLAGMLNLLKNSNIAKNG
jgi:hypothetical protein